MLNKIKSIFSSKSEGEELYSLPYEDEYYDLELEKKQKRNALFREKVGDSPLDDIDYIIENGFDGYYELEEQCRIEIDKEYEPEVDDSSWQEVIDNYVREVTEPKRTYAIGKSGFKERWDDLSFLDLHIDKHLVPKPDPCEMIETNREYINMLDDVIKEKNEKKSQQKVTIDTKTISIRSTACGSLTYVSPISGIEYHWSDNKMTIEMSMEDYKYTKDNIGIFNYMEVVQHEHANGEMEYEIRGGIGNSTICRLENSKSDTSKLNTEEKLEKLKRRFDGKVINLALTERNLMTALKKKDYVMYSSYSSLIESLNRVLNESMVDADIVNTHEIQKTNILQDAVALYYQTRGTV